MSDNAPYGPTYQKRRNEALERDNYTCQGCGADESLHGKLHVHHKSRPRTFNNLENAHNVDNLITLCPGCHASFDRGHTKLLSDDIPDHLTRSDLAVLNMLQEHPMTPSYIAMETTYAKGTIRKALKDLAAHGYVEQMGGGLWQLLNDPR